MCFVDWVVSYLNQFVHSTFDLYLACLVVYAAIKFCEILNVHKGLSDTMYLVYKQMGER